MAEQKEGIYPIESNLKSTGNGNNRSAKTDAAFDDAFDEDENDALFEDDDGDALNDDADWGDATEVDVLQSKVKQMQMQMEDGEGADAGLKPVIGVGEENPYGEGDEVVVRQGGRPQLNVGDPKQKCWICPVCSAINNLLLTSKRYNFACCVCGQAYHPNAVVIFSNEWDGDDGAGNNGGDGGGGGGDSFFEVWHCPFCTLQNDASWSKCDGCASDAPPQHLRQVGYTMNQPRRVNEAAPNLHPHANGQLYEQGRVGWNIPAAAAPPKNQVAWAPENGGKNKRKQRKNSVPAVAHKPRLGNLGVPRRMDAYPTKNVDDQIEPRLKGLFGAPYRNRLLCSDRKNTFCGDFNVTHSRLEWASYSSDAQNFVDAEIVGRGFAINPHNGWIASMSSDYIFVFSPFGGVGYRLRARYQLHDEQRLKEEDLQNSRIRFLGDAIFVWSFARSRVYCFRVGSDSIALVDVLRDSYFKDSQTMDIAVTDKLLILLFDRWCGVYKLYPKFEWYHAVAFANKGVNCYSFDITQSDEEFEQRASIREEQRAFFQGQKSALAQEIFEEQKAHYGDTEDGEWATNKNYIFINAENQLIGIHPTNPTFDFLHCAKDTHHGKVKFATSKRYGVFFISNDGTEVHQSSHLQHDSVQRLISLQNAAHAADTFFGVEQVHDSMLREYVDKFVNLQFDETFGVSGRLLLYCKTKKSQFVLHQIFNHAELSPFTDELARIEYYLMPGSTKKPFNLVVHVYEMLYGDDLVSSLLESPIFNPTILRIKQQQEKELLLLKQQQQENPGSAVVDMDLEEEEEYPKEGKGDGVVMLVD